MKFMMKKSRLLLVLLFACAACFLQACQEFIHDSFDTFQGVIVDESGNPMSGVKLNLYPIAANNFGSSRPGSLTTNRMVTNAAGEFKVVFPSRNRNDVFYLVPPSELAFEVDQFGTLTKVRELIIESILRDKNRVIDLGKITVVTP
jgi:hypothetical protein